MSKFPLKNIGRQHNSKFPVKQVLLLLGLTALRWLQAFPGPKPLSVPAASIVLDASDLVVEW